MSRKKNKTRLHVAHASMQWSDPAAQQEHDARRIFQRARVCGYAWITGTEAGANSKGLPRRLRRHARANGYRLRRHRGADVWIAVRKDFIARGSWRSGYIPVLPSGRAAGSTRNWTPKGVIWVSWVTPDLGRIAVAAGHYLTGGRNPKRAKHGRANHWLLNRRLARAIGRWAREHGDGKALAFYGGDQNMLDNRNREPQGDTFFGQPLTSAWDELGTWQNTGHGNIDVIASFNGDTRVSAAYIHALTDREFHLYTDHFLVEAGYDIRHLPRA